MSLKKTPTEYPNIKAAFDSILHKEELELRKSNRYTSPLMCYDKGPFGIPVLIPVNDVNYSYTAFYNDAESNQYVLSRLKSQRFSLKPNLKDRKYLFRGQSTYYPHCLPSIYRTGKEEKHNFLIEECALGQELMMLMLSHPLVQLLDIGFPMGKFRFQPEMNLFVLAQHYYNKTSLMDFTSDPSVAAFFAVTDYDPISDTYSPVLDETRFGVLYLYELNPETSFKQDNLRTIGLQVFPRSGAQSGFLLEMTQDDDLNSTPNVSFIKFRHNAELSQKIFDLFQGGKALFPDDILSRHWNTCNKNKKYVSEAAMVLNSIMNTSDEYNNLVEAIKKYGYNIIKGKPVFHPEELTEYYKDIENGFWEEFCNKIFIPGDMDGKLKEHLLQIEKNMDYSWAFKPDIEHSINYKDGYLMSRYEKALLV